MIHPDTRLEFISPEVGYGIIATKKIPAGTITFVQDPLDICIEANSPLLNDPKIESIIDKYSYMNRDGAYVISWDHGKYMNHCCYANTLTTGYGFEIAIRDIELGEEVTDDYGIFTVGHQMNISCSREGCRRIVGIDDFDKNLPIWDEAIKKALGYLKSHYQPLYQFVDVKTARDLENYLQTGSNYQSVSLQKPQMGNRLRPVTMGHK